MSPAMAQYLAHWILMISARKDAELQEELQEICTTWWPQLTAREQTSVNKMMQSLHGTRLVLK
jgi:hypothetical protein